MADPDPVPPDPVPPDPVPERVRGLLALFTDELRGVSFPDLDADVLGEFASAVRAESVEVAKAREALEQAKAALAESHAVLERSADRAIAYARIFADGNEPLLARLEELAAGPAKKSEKGRGRSKDAPRKTRKSKAGGPELPFESQPAPTQSASERDSESSSDLDLEETLAAAS